MDRPSDGHRQEYLTHDLRAARRRRNLRRRCGPRYWNDAVWRFEFGVAADVRGRLAVVASLSNYLGRLDGELPADLPHALAVAVEDLGKEIERAFDCHDRLRELGELPRTSKRLEPGSRA